MRKAFAGLTALALAGFAFAQNSPADTAPSTAIAAASAQSRMQFAANSMIPVELSKSLDAKKAKVGQPVETKTTMDMVSQGRIIMPRGTRIIGHVTGAEPHSKQSPHSMIGIAFDRAVMNDGENVPMSAAVQAIGPPLSHSGPAEGPPTGPMGGGSMGGAIGTAPGGGISSSGQPISDDPSVRPVSPPEKFPTGSSHPLSAGSQGVIELKGLELGNSAQGSVISSSKKNVHLDSGTQMILRVQ